jgi:hypothetical protein
LLSPQRKGHISELGQLLGPVPTILIMIVPLMTYQDSRPLAGNRMMSLIGGFLSGVILMDVFLQLFEISGQGPPFPGRKNAVKHF